MVMARRTFGLSRIRQIKPKPEKPGKPEKPEKYNPSSRREEMDLSPTHDPNQLELPLGGQSIRDYRKSLIEPRVKGGILGKKLLTNWLADSRFSNKVFRDLPEGFTFRPRYARSFNQKQGGLYLRQGNSRAPHEGLGSIDIGMQYHPSDIKRTLVHEIAHAWDPTVHKPWPWQTPPRPSETYRVRTREADQEGFAVGIEASHAKAAGKPHESVSPYDADPAGWFPLGSGSPSPPRKYRGGVAYHPEDIYSRSRQEAFHHGRRESRPEESHEIPGQLSLF